MKFKFLLFISICMLLFSSCFDGPWTDIRDVPFRGQTMSNYCGIACIQMWALYDGADPEPTQDEIYYRITENSDHGGYIWAEDRAKGVFMFTNSTGYLMNEIMENIGQDHCIASCIAAIKDFRLAIMPFQGGRHAVLVNGFTWHYEDGLRVADKMYYHDPAKGPDRVAPAADLKSDYFTVDESRGSYWVIVGKYKHVSDGISGYNIFIQEGGTFYGGPSVYDPFTFTDFTTSN